MTEAPQQFWDESFRHVRPRTFTPSSFLEQASPALRKFLSWLPPVEGAAVLDVGCGNGELAVYVAKLGADVVAVDISAQAIANTRALADANGIGDRVDALQLDAFELERTGRSFALVIGKFILHELEPFGEFVGVLERVLRPGGRAMFYENSARNPILMLMRRSLTGRFGIPKGSHTEEHPLQAHEIEQLRRSFDVEIEYPTFLFFHFVGAYLFRRKPFVTHACDALDRAVYKLAPPLRQYSYHQVVRVRKR